MKEFYGRKAPASDKARDQPPTGIEASIRAAQQYARTGHPIGGREPQQILGAA